jgi:hypothetical protein
MRKKGPTPISRKKGPTPISRKKGPTPISQGGKLWMKIVYFVKL